MATTGRPVHLRGENGGSHDQLDSEAAAVAAATLEDNTVSHLFNLVSDPVVKLSAGSAQKESDKQTGRQTDRRTDSAQ